MKKIVLVLSLLITATIAGAQYQIMGYFPNTQYKDYVIVYGYYQTDGTFTLSHCRTNVISGNLYSNQTYLDINTCTIRPVSQSGMATMTGPSG